MLPGGGELTGVGVKDGLDVLYSPVVLGLIPGLRGATELEQALLGAATGCNVSCPSQTFPKKVPVTRESSAQKAV